MRYLLLILALLPSQSFALSPLLDLSIGFENGDLCKTNIDVDGNKYKDTRVFAVSASLWHEVIPNIYASIGVSSIQCAQGQDNDVVNSSFFRVQYGSVKYIYAAIHKGENPYSEEYFADFGVGQFITETLSLEFRLLTGNPEDDNQDPRKDYIFGAHINF